MKFICLGYFDEEVFDSMPLDEVNVFIDACRTYGSVLGDSLVGFDLLQSPAYSKTVQSIDGKVVVTDGPAVKAEKVLIPILTIDADNIAHAAELMSTHPGLAKSGSFEIRRVEDLGAIMEESIKRGDL